MDKGLESNKYDGNRNTVDIATTNQREETRYVEITNNDSVITTHDVTPINAGIFNYECGTTNQDYSIFTLTSMQGTAVI